MHYTASGTAEALYSAVDGRLCELLGSENPWTNCISVGVDNINVGWCPCHVIHNTAHKAGEIFTSESGFDLKEFVIDLFYSFDKSTKRNELASYSAFVTSLTAL